jgi:hypothetical protein
VEIVRLAEPLQIDSVAPQVVEMGSVRGAETVAQEVYDKAQGIDIGGVLAQQSHQTIHGTEKVAAHLGIVGEGGDEDGVGKAGVEVLEMPVVALGIDGVALDFIGPVGIVDYAVGTQHFVYMASGSGGEIVVGHLGHNTMAYLTPGKDLLGGKR